MRAGPYNRAPITREPTLPVADFVQTHPTTAEINALPPGWRAYIHDLETRADPAGDLRALRLAEDENRMLRARLAADLGGVAMSELKSCGRPAPGDRELYCTRVAGHNGTHIASIGPYVPGFSQVLLQWDDPVVLRGGQPGGGKTTSARLQAIRLELDRHDEANNAGAGKEDGPSPVTAVDDLRWLLRLVETGTGRVGE